MQFGWLFVLLSSPGVTGAAPPDFQRDVRPILSSACFHCHGPDDEQREADLRLDTREGAVADLGGYAAIAPGLPGESELLARVLSEDPDARMPPPESGDTLTAEQIDTLRTWIEAGAGWSEHWAFVAPRRPLLPEVADASWVAHPIDAFILARLEAEGLKPSPEAEPETLVRRLYLDLVGLPPTPELADAFRRRRASKISVGHGRLDKAYVELVEQLLSSPHYGEKWARHWLDASRYADSDGFEKDKPRRVWMYRNWVIEALNRDLAYDQFIIEQIAGDLLPEAGQQQRVATGFLRNSMLNEEGGIDPEQFRMEAMFDRMDAIGKTVLGLTVQCAQCHNHKYDPITQQDYYRLFAFINNCHEGSEVVYTAAELRQRDDILQKIRSLEEQLRDKTPDWRERLERWIAANRDVESQWHPLRIENANDNAQRYLRQQDESLIAQGYAPTRFQAAFTAETDLRQIYAVRLEVLTDPNLPAGGPGRSVDGLFALSEFKVKATSREDPGQTRWINFARVSADFANGERQLGSPFVDKEGRSGSTGRVEFAIDGKNETAWGVDAGPGRRNQSRQAVFVADENIAFANGTLLTIQLVQMHGGWNSDDNQNLNLGRFRISVSADSDAAADRWPRQVRSIVQRPQVQIADLDSDEFDAVFSYWRTTVDAWKAINGEIEQLWAEHPEGTTQLVLRERNQPRRTCRLERGDFLKPQETVTPGVPAVLHRLEIANNVLPNRLDFARWLVDRRSPTTARAVVNRVWQAYFGTGLVETSEDLGSQGTPPSHPQLLDWLAVEFMEQGWSLKWLHRQIVQSSTYRQSSRVTQELAERDAANRLLARGPRFRVDAEVVRDITLAAAGLLNREVGGPSVYPPAPAFLFEPPVSYGPKTWGHEPGPANYRRGLYTFRFRSVPYPAMATFDAPSGESACVRRPRSNTPLQALTLLNEPLFVQSARSLALLTLNSGGSTNQDRMNFAFRRCLTRCPDRDEMELLLDLLEDVRSGWFHDDADEEVSKLTAADPARPASLPDGVTRGELAAWTVVCRVLLNLDETITKQ
jgi:mono/diheme cytochrome c family protein